MSYFIAMIKLCRVGVILIPTAQTRSEVVMKKYLTILCSLLVSSSISFAWASTAQQTTGQIYVRGAIVDPACEINFTLDQAEYQCYKHNKVFTSTQSIFPTSFEQSSSIILPQDMGKAEIRWMDGAEKNGIINVQYF